MFFEFYKDKFLESDTTITWGGDTITRLWDDSTLLLYCFIVAMIILFGSFAERKRSLLVCRNIQCHYNKYLVNNVNKILMFIFFLLLLVMGCRHTEVGIDTIQYKGDIELNITLQKRFLDSTTEPLYKIIQHIFHVLFNDGTIGIFIYSLAILCFLYGGLKRYYGDVNLYVSLLVYVCIFFFPSMNLLRISLAASFIFYNSHFLIESKYIKFAGIILSACLIHYSSMVMFLPFITYLIYKRSKVVASIVFAVLAVVIIISTTLLTDYIFLINRYSGYIEDNEATGTIGIMLFVDYLPCLLVSFYILRKKISGLWADLMVCFTVSAFLVRMLAYYLGAASRLNFHFPILLMLLLPYWIFYLRRNEITFYKPMIILVTIWCLFRLHICFSADLAGHGIMPYKFFWQY